MSFGPARKSYRATYPFTYLVNDGVWVLDQPLDTTKGYSVQAFIDVKGAFSDEVYNRLKNNPLLIKHIAETILESNFPMLIAYQYSCAVFMFNVRLGDALVAVEAAREVIGQNADTGYVYILKNNKRNKVPVDETSVQNESREFYRGIFPCGLAKRIA